MIYVKPKSVALNQYGPLMGHGNILRWATELFKKLLDLLKNSVSFCHYG